MYEVIQRKSYKMTEMVDPTDRENSEKNRLL